MADRLIKTLAMKPRRIHLTRMRRQIEQRRPPAEPTAEQQSPKSPAPVAPAAVEPEVA